MKRRLPLAGIARLVIDPDEPVYAISVVARLTRLPEWTLRALDKRKIVSPRKTRGNTRLYSGNDMQRLHCIYHLMRERKVNISALKVFVELYELEP